MKRSKDLYKPGPPMTMREFAERSGISYEAVRMHIELTDAIKVHCRKHGLSQRKLAGMVPGLTQDRVSDFFRFTTSGISLEKLLEIASVLKLKIRFSVRPAA